MIIIHQTGLPTHLPSCPSQNVRCGDHAKPTTLTERSGAASCRHEGGARSINQCTKEVQWHAMYSTYVYIRTSACMYCTTTRPWRRVHDKCTEQRAPKATPTARSQLIIHIAKPKVFNNVRVLCLHMPQPLLFETDRDNERCSTEILQGVSLLQLQPVIGKWHCS